MPWRRELRRWAWAYAERLAERPGILGVAIGGSLARGQEWRHSDLEVGVLVEEKNATMGHFHTDAGRGVEIFQMIRADVASQVNQVESGDASPVLKWPIQLWKCRPVHDPTGLLARYKACFDRHLFSDPLVQARITESRERLRKSIPGLRDLAAAGKGAEAVVAARWAMNEAILALHWAHRELPRSQNRTDSRFRRLCRRHGMMDAYAAYREIFGLAGATAMLRRVWPGLRADVLEITRSWGDATRDFFDQAVDSHFAWGQNAGVLSVYRLYLPKMGGERSIVHRLDADDATVDPRLVEFLGLANRSPRDVDRLATLIEGCLARLDRRA